ncbi:MULTISPECIES: ABC transporter ATP-binding protein [Dactylosporangium]|uniref:ABC transporter ATP-binding protein n=2 Tax=Dactylosporangium TaxID=35753 RepID=A0A9W6KT45_9ACTN|nr:MULTISPECIES: ATP-binding cassette domain-containing protein [Dactylosporangium]UAB97984.1 ATP-binding cassette domain-containing protein [Dactylosporangium vinaceum]UWZ46231.1 ATP-binding cassette domain-containing protein [Dactylosporangium matsuzakiense]GLL06199.1 ABC transporter ATP-binding protein [Dactylosporangium matsuzakiense]
MTPALEIDGLVKTYQSVFGKPRAALDRLDMVVEPGQIHGFLGPNGSGKSTTLKTLLGLLRADGGRMAIFGEPVPRRQAEVAPRVGAIVEAPAFFGNFSGYKTLSLLAKAGGVPKQRVGVVLDQVGLSDRSEDLVRSYSMGMRQRLAVASALLKDPDLLILDEPNNGLDPAGVREMRDLLRGHADRGKTVVISSHILAEIHQICDTVTIISRGRTVAAGPVSEVLAVADKGAYRVRVDDHQRAAEILAGAGAEVSVAGDHIVVYDLADPAWVSHTLGVNDMWVRELAPVAQLEDAFLTITGGGPRPGAFRPVDNSDWTPEEHRAS